MEASSETQSPRSDLVSSRDVDGTEVYDLEGAHIGTVDHFMIDKASGKVRYAVVTFGGILDLGAEHFSILWKELAYDGSLDIRRLFGKMRYQARPRHLIHSDSRRVG